MDDLQACILTALQILSAFSVINNTYKAAVSRFSDNFGQGEIISPENKNAIPILRRFLYIRIAAAAVCVCYNKCSYIFFNKLNLYFIYTLSHRINRTGYIFSIIPYRPLYLKRGVQFTVCIYFYFCDKII